MKKILFIFLLIAMPVFATDSDTTADENYSFMVEPDFVVNASLRTSLPSTEYPAETGDVIFTFKRNSSATFEDVDGIVHTVTDDVPRFGGTFYDSVTGLHSELDGNGKMIPTTPAFESTVFITGDSISGSYFTRWHNYLSGLLSQGIDYSTAIPGAHLNKNSPVPAVENDIYERYMAADKGCPSLIVLQGGTNDLTELTEFNPESRILPLMMQNMEAMINDAVIRAQTVMVFPIPVFGAASKYSAAREAARIQYNNWLRDLCAVRGVTYLEVDRILESPSVAGQISDRNNANDLLTLTTDGLHLNTLGARLISEYVYALLNRKYLKGLYLEGPGTNLLLYSEDFKNEVWSAINARKAEKKAVVAPDGNTGCYLITAEADGGKVVQDLGIRSAAKVVFSIWLKRKTGTGRVYLSLDGGTRLAPVYVDDQWRRVYVNTGTTCTETWAINYSTHADPDPSVVLETSGDAVYVWGAQFEEKTFPTSYIATAASKVTREADTCSFPRDNKWLTDDIGSIGLTVIPEWCSEERCSLEGYYGSFMYDATTSTGRLRMMMSMRYVNFTRDLNLANSNNIFSGSTSYNRYYTERYARQKTGGIARGQVIPTMNTYSWSTGTSAIVNGFSCGVLTSSTAAVTTKPVYIGTSIHLGSKNDGTMAFNGYVRDLYMTPDVIDKATASRLSDLWRYEVPPVCEIDSDCSESYECVDGSCEPKPDDPPVIGSGPFLEAGTWPVLPTDPDSPVYLNQNYDVLWTFSDDYISCSENCTHKALYQKVGDSTWKELSAIDGPVPDTAVVTVPVNQLQNATYAFRFAETDCAGQTTHSGTYYFKVDRPDQPPIFTTGPLWIGPWIELSTDPANPHKPESPDVLFWAYDDDKQTCTGSSVNWMYRPVELQAGEVVALGDWVVEEPWRYLWYAWIENPGIADVPAVPGLYEFKMTVTDCLDQTIDSEVFWGKRYYFRVD
jgi:lysophospholipase L1-like esterase